MDKCDKGLLEAITAVLEDNNERCCDDKKERAALARELMYGASIYIAMRNRYAKYRAASDPSEGFEDRDRDCHDGIRRRGHVAMEKRRHDCRRSQASVTSRLGAGRLDARPRLLAGYDHGPPS